MRILNASLLPILVLSLGSSCGILGEKGNAKRSIAIQEETGCLDGLGNHLEAFLNGTISEAQWIGTWSCLEDTLDRFETMVQPSDPRGFTKSDIQGLAKTFLVRKSPVTAEFVEAFFAVKSSLIGGDSRIFAKGEVSKLRSIIALIRSETPSFIPLLRQRKENPRAESLRPLVRKIAEFGERFSQRLSPENNSTLSLEMATQFMGELGKMSLNDSESHYREWASFTIEVKKVLVRGAEDGIAGSDWKEMIRFGSEFGSIVLGLWSVQPDEPDFQLELADAGRKIFDRTFVLWNGKVPFSALEKVIAVTPASLLPVRAQEFQAGLTCALRKRFSKVPENSLCPAYPGCPKQGCRPALARILSAKSDDSLDLASIDTLHDVYRTGTRAKLHLEAIIGGLKEEITPADFSTLADRYSRGLSPDEVKEVERLKRIAKLYSGMHVQGSPEMNYGDIRTHSMENLVRFSFYEAIAEKLLQAYASKTNPLRGTVNDLFFLTQDWEMLLTSLSLVHPLKEKVHEKRFREANLFMIPGNGDNYMDVKETAAYLGTIVSISNLSSRIQKDIFKDDPITGYRAPCRPVGTDSCLKLPQYNIQCFRDHYFGNLSEYWRNFPGLLNDYEAMSHAEQRKIQRGYEAASKLSGLYDETDVSAFDVNTFAGLPHYMEGLMKKFDKRGGKEDGYLDRTEIDELVWPTFKTEFKKITNLPGWGLLDWVNKPLFIYLLKKGGLPFKCQTSPKAGEIAKFTAWMATGEHKETFRIRRDRMFTVFEELSKPILPGCKGYVPPAVCKGSSDALALSIGEELGVSQTSLLHSSGIELDSEMEAMLQSAVSEDEKRALNQ